MPPKSIDWSRLAGGAASIAVALLAVTVQWGAVNTKLDQLDRRLCELVDENRAMRKELADLERQFSFHDGKDAGAKGKP